MSEEKRMEDGGLAELKHHARAGFKPVLLTLVPLAIIYLVLVFAGLVPGGAAH